MGKAQKKHGKGRLDHYYRLAKEKGYRARSSFKILQLNQKYGFFNVPKGQKRPMCIIDLCAAPGSWCQVATQHCPINSLIVGVDLAPIRPLPNVITFQSDITTDHCRSQLRGYLKTWKADVVMHDGAPNVGMAWAQDAFTQSELVLQSLKLAVEFLAPGGWFVTKVFRSKDYNKLMWVFQQFFEKCEATKPPSSRNVSAEIFVVCKNFKAPKHIDPRLLDPKYVFEELQDSAPNNQAKIYNPEKKTRKREGYEEGTELQFKRIPVMDYVKTEDPITCLGETNEFSWDKTDPDVKELKKLPQTTPDLLAAFKDLKVLGKKDFRVILKWRLAARKLLGLDKVEEPEVEPAPQLSTEDQIEKEIEELREGEAAKRKRDRRKRHEQKQKEIMKMQLNMATPADLGEDAGNQRDTLFDLNSVNKTGQARALVTGKKMAPVLPAGANGDVDFGDENLDALDDMETSESEPEDDILEIESDDDAAQLESQLDGMYEQYKEKRAKSAEAQAKRAREAEVWEGIESADEASSASSDDESDIENGSAKPAALSNRAAMFFDNPVFEGMEAASDSEEHDTDAEDDEEAAASESETAPKAITAGTGSNGSDSEPAEAEPAEPESEDEERFDPLKDEDMTDLQIKMTLAQQLALGQINKHDLINEGYNKLSFRDRDGLPAWFLEDEGKHSKVIKPITKEASAAIKEQMKVMNARPIKKVAEATARKKMKAQKRLEKIRKKSDLINEDATKSEREKSEEIARLMRRAKSKTKPKVTVVRAGGANRGLKGRPKGVKGKYKMVDGVMKKEQRSLKRIAKKRK